MKMYGITGCLALFCLLQSVSAQVVVSPDTLDVDPKQPTLVDLDLKNVSAEQAFDAVCAVSKIPTRVNTGRVSLQKNIRKTISVKFVKTPWAAAMCQVACASDVALSRANGYIEYAIEPVPKGTNQTERGENWIYGPADNDGPFCGVFDRAWYTRTLELDDPAKVRRNLMIRVDIIPEPQILSYSINPWLSLPEVKDENGLLLRDTTAGAQMIRCAGDNIQGATGVPELTDKTGHELVSITARRQMGIIRKFRRVDIEGDDLVGGTEFNTDGISATLVQPNLKKGRYTLKLKADNRDMQLLADGTLFLMLDDSNRVMASGGRSADISGNQVTIAYDFWRMAPEDGDSHPATLLVYLPLEGGVVSPTFHFSHVPLEGTEAKPK